MTSLSATISAATATTALPAQGSPGNNGLIMLLSYAGIFALFYFLFIRPSQKQRKAIEDRVKQVKRGDEVVTAGGVIGEVVHIRENMKDGVSAPTMEDRITIKSADARIVIERRAITRVITGASAEEEKVK
jgi:preprotein translocase subunit YajC